MAAQDLAADTYWNTNLEEYAYSSYGATTGKRLQVTKKVLNSSNVLGGCDGAAVEGASEL